MRKILLLFGFLIVVHAIHGQQRLLSNQYIQNLFSVNPAVAGWEDYIDVRSIYRKQWAGLASAPESYAISIQGALNYYEAGGRSLPMFSKYSLNHRQKMASGKVAPWYRHGMGLTMAVDKTSPLKTNTAQASYALHMKLNKTLKGAVGIAIGVRQWRLNPSDLNLETINDPAFSGEFMSEIIPNINMGLLVYSSSFYASISVDQLLKQDIGFGLANGNASLQWHGYASVGYRIIAGTHWKLTPSMLLRYTKAASPSVDINLQFQYNDYIWGGLGYRQQGALMAQVGINLLEWLSINYSYDMASGVAQTLGQNGHEVMLGVKIPVRQYGLEKQYF